MTRPQSSTITRIVIAALLPIAALSAQPAFAAQSALANQETETAQVSVAYSDLKLDTKAGQEKLSTRINSAVKQACDIHSTRNLNERRDMQNCKSKAMKSAYQQLNIIMAKRNIDSKLAKSRIFIVGN